MNNTKKMVLVPYQDGGDDTEDVFATQSQAVPSQESETKQKRGNSIRKYAAERQQKLLQIVLKLASYGGYDEKGMIKTPNGEAADIVPLLLFAASPGRNVRGLSHFVDLLYKAGVTPDLIINVNVRDELANRLKKSPNTYTPVQTPLRTRKASYSSRSARTIPLPQSPVAQVAEEPKRGTKRIREDDDDASRDHSANKSIKTWNSKDSDDSVDGNE